MEFKHSFKTSAREQLSLVVYNTGFQKCSPGYGWGAGVRDHYLLHYIVSGQGIYQTGGRTFVLHAGDAFLAFPEHPISYQADAQNPWEYYWVGFSGPSAPLLLAQTPLSDAHPVLHPAVGNRLRDALLDIYKARGSDYPSAVRMAGYLQAALGLLMEETARSHADTLSSYAQRGADFLQQNYSRGIGVSDIAQQVGISRSHLCRAFQAAFGCSPVVYLTRYRLQRAAQLLRHSDLSIEAVALSAGFTDAFYFSRVFHRTFGQTPSAYRVTKGSTP